MKTRVRSLSSLLQRISQEQLAEILDVLNHLVKSPDEVSDEDFVAAVRVCSEFLNFSTQDLAIEFAVTPSTISRWKNGKNMPIHLARKAVLMRVAAAVSERIELMREDASSRA